MSATLAVDPPAASPGAPAAPRAFRMMSVDALRGFDMFWIIGGEEAAQTLDKASNGPVIGAIARQLKHASWAGFHFFDGIFPLFLFLVGVSIVFSIDRVRREHGHRSALWRIARRSALLFGIGVLYYGGLKRDWPDVALSGVLPRIALCYLAASILYIYLPRKGIAIAAAVCLVGYWALLTFAPFPDVNLKHAALGKKGRQATAKSSEELFAGAAMTNGTFDEGHNYANYVDARWLPGRKGNLYYTNEGLLSTIPAVATTLFGIMAGWVLTMPLWSDRRKVAWLIGAGAAGIALGLLWSLQFPIIKRIWTSSFCLVASGASAVMLGLFYQMVDVWRWQKWCRPFVWIGTNALVLYLVVELIDPEEIAARFIGGDVSNFFDERLFEGCGNVMIAAVGLIFPVLLARFMYQRKIFIRL